MTERKRSANWLINEKMLLLDLVTDHFNIIENKKTDGVTMKQKNAEWIKISDEFNSQTVNNHRTAENLKSQWESLKKTTKKAASSARQSLIQTGGGPPKPPNNDPLQNRILGLLSTSAVGLINKFDNDGILFINNEMDDNSLENGTAHARVPDALDRPEITTSTSHPVTFISLDSQNVDSSQDWGDYTPKMLQTPVSPFLRFEKDTPIYHLPKEEACSTIKTPKLKKQWSSKRRPTLPSSNTLEELHKKKIQALETQQNFAQREREESKQIFEINMEIKKEILRQEKLKTKLLLLELKRKKCNQE